MDKVDQADLLERYRRLIEISSDLASTLDLEVLLNRIVHAAADLSGAEAASILLYDEVKRELYFDAASNMEEPMMRGLIVPVDSSIAGWIVTNRQPLIIPDTQKDPRHFGGVGKATQVTTTSILGVPMILKGKVVGALEAINKKEGEFELADQDLLMVLGAQAAVAIENARLFQQSDLISELVHELRTPMTSLNTAARLLLRSEIQESARTQIVEVILSETNRLAELTTAFLDLARLESGRAQFQIQLFEAKALLEECVSLMESRAQEKGIRIYLDVADQLPALRADRDKLKQVMINLLSNAIKYNILDGVITLKAEAVQDEMVLQVSDTGPGISPEHLPYIFSKFYRVPGSERTVQGTGLGLSICKRIVDVHRGRINVQSEVGKGTTFSIFLPLK